MINKNQKIIAFLVLGVLCFSFVTGMASATAPTIQSSNDQDNDGFDDEIEEANERVIEISTSSNQIEIESSSENSAREDSIELEIVYNEEGISIELSYESEIEENETEYEYEMEVGVSFKKIIEYIDIDGNGLYEKEIDTKKQEYLIDNTELKSISSEQISNDTRLHYIEIGTVDNVFTVHIYVVEEFTIVNQTLVTPTQTKFDIEINNFNYLDSNSRLALYSRLEYENEYEIEEETEDEEEGYSEDEKGIETQSGKYIGGFTWKESALVDGVSMPVLTGEIEIDDENSTLRKIYLNYPHGTEIYHDPKIGIFFASLSDPFPMSILMVGIVAIIAVLGLSSVIFIRKRQSSR